MSPLAAPDEGEALVLLLDQVGVDRSGEARVVQLDRDVLVAALAGAVPGRADFDCARLDAEVRGGVGGFLDAAHGDLGGLQAKSLDGAGEAVVGFGEGADGCHGDSLLCLVSGGRALRDLSMANVRDRQRPGLHPKGRNGVEDGKRAVSCLARNAAKLQGKKPTVRRCRRGRRAQMWP